MVLIVNVIFDGELFCIYNVINLLDKNWSYENYLLYWGKLYNFFVVFIKILINVMVVKVI